MPRLSNSRWEAFTQAYVRGATAGNATASYKAAYGKSDRTGAARCLQRANICQRISELQAQTAEIEAAATAAALEKLKITKETVLTELAKIGFCNMLDYLRITDNGDVMVDLSALNRDTAAAVEQVTMEVYDEGRGDKAQRVKRIRFKLANKLAALVAIGRHFGMFVDAVQTPDAPAVPTKFVDAPPPETFEQWIERRKRELN